MKRRVVLLFISALFLLTGCGSDSAPRDPSTLSGNWQLVGPVAPQATLPPVSQLSMTLDVNGTSLSGGASVLRVCGGTNNFNVDDVWKVTGTVKKDGSFTLASTDPKVTGTIQGISPITAGGLWSGTYALSFSDPTNPSYCTGSVSGAINATTFPSITGKFTGTFDSVDHFGGYHPLWNVQMTATQGGAAVDPITNQPFTSNFGLTSSWSMQGKGDCSLNPPPANATGSGFMYGDIMVLTIVRNDGSTWTNGASSGDGSSLGGYFAFTDAKQSHIGSDNTATCISPIPYVYAFSLDRQIP